MKKVFHKNMQDWAVPKDTYEPFYVLTYHISLSEVDSVVKNVLKALKPFIKHYQLVVEFSEPQTDTRFKVGHVGGAYYYFSRIRKRCNAYEKSSRFLILIKSSLNNKIYA